MTWHSKKPEESTCYVRQTFVLALAQTGVLSLRYFFHHCKKVRKLFCLLKVKQKAIFDYLMKCCNNEFLCGVSTLWNNTKQTENQVCGHKSTKLSFCDHFKFCHEIVFSVVMIYDQKHVS